MQRMDKSSWIFVDEKGERHSWEGLVAKGAELERGVVQGQQFIAAEHQRIGEKALENFLSDERVEGRSDHFKTYLGSGFDADSQRLILSEGMRVKAGDIIALAGDFYGLEKRPICEGRASVAEDTCAARFKGAYASLAEGQQAEVDAILEVVAQERLVVKAAERLVGVYPELQPSDALESRSEQYNHRYTAITRRFSWFPSWVSSRYGALAHNNVDHFGEQAQVAFETGMRVAFETARSAERAYGDGEVPTEASCRMFCEAVGQAMFASHYLTDMFATGHARVPSMALRSNLGLSKGSLCVKAMHDEENRLGLRLSNAHKPEGWSAQGDGYLFNEASQTNCEASVAAVESVLEAVYEAYCDASLSDEDLLEQLRGHYPRVVAEENYPALFKVVEGQLNYRIPVMWAEGVDDVTYRPLTKRALFKAPLRGLLKETFVGIFRSSPLAPEVETRFEAALQEIQRGEPGPAVGSQGLFGGSAPVDDEELDVAPGAELSPS